MKSIKVTIIEDLFWFKLIPFVVDRVSSTNLAGDCDAEKLGQDVCESTEGMVMGSNYEILIVCHIIRFLP